jgi:shikimate dehydrogenase
VTRAVTGATRVAGVIGDPIVHSASPRIHNAAYAALGLDWIYVAFRVAPGRAGDALAGAGALGIAGLNVTMPHKADAARTCDELSAAATRLGAVNTVVVRDGRLVGDSTDGPGFLRALADEEIDPGGLSVVLFGAGGAARAIAGALGDVGARVTVAARREDAAASAAALVPGGTAVALDRADLAIETADIVVNATPLGMREELPPFDVGRLGSSQVVVDTVYEPSETPLLAAARARGARVVNGLGMLVHQAALAFEAFTGVSAPLDAMRAAARGSP